MRVSNHMSRYVCMSGCCYVISFMYFIFIKPGLLKSHLGGASLCLSN